MKTVLAFGDSLTWGHCPETGGRHPYDDRWPSVLEAGIPGIRVIGEGLRGRLTAYDNGAGPCDLNGARALPMLLHSHAPLDAVIVMLGLNDIWQGYRPDQVAAGLRRIVELIRCHPTRLPDPRIPGILLVAQPPLVAGHDPAVTGPLIAASRRLARMTEMVAMEYDLPWVDMRGVAQASELDCVHLDAVNTRAMGEALIAPVGQMLGLEAR